MNRLRYLRILNFRFMQSEFFLYFFLSFLEPLRGFISGAARGPTSLLSRVAHMRPAGQTLPTPDLLVFFILPVEDTLIDGALILKEITNTKKSTQMFSRLSAGEHEMSSSFLMVMVMTQPLGLLLLEDIRIVWTWLVPHFVPKIGSIGNVLNRMQCHQYPSIFFLVFSMLNRIKLFKFRF